VSSGCALSDEAARLRFHRFVDPADGLVFERHRVFNSQNAFLRFGARAGFDQLLRTVRTRDDGIDQVGIERFSYSAQAPQRDAIFRLTFFQLQRELTARAQPAREFARRDTERLPDSPYPSLRRARNLPRCLEWLQTTIQLFQMIPAL
jgi:hypothetical protein